MARGSDESFTEYILRASNSYALETTWAGSSLFPELEMSTNNLKKIGLHMIVKGEMIHQPQIYTPDSLKKLRERGIKVKNLAEESIKAIHHKLNIAEHYFPESGKFIYGLLQMESQVLEYKGMLAEEIHYEIDTRENNVTGVPDILLKFNEQHYFVMNIDFKGRFEEIIPVDDKEHLEELLADEELPVVSLSNVSDYLENNRIVSEATKNYGEFTRRQATQPEKVTSKDSTNQDSE